MRIYKRPVSFYSSVTMEYVLTTPPPAQPAPTPNAPTKWRPPRVRRAVHLLEPAAVGVPEHASEAPTGV